MARFLGKARVGGPPASGGGFSYTATDARA